ncbi:MAG: 3-dehydroquinate dehydratase [Dehalococcoidia bacterium]|nr:3-dehydroquinate dehydratase [Dehalococcoidia bacterium]
MVNLLLVHGPNLNLLGERKPRSTAGRRSSTSKPTWGCRRIARAAVLCFQSNHEGSLIDFLHENRKLAQGVVINARAYPHSSVALRDAIEAIQIPVVEVHISNTHAREGFRHRSLISPVCLGQVTGLGRDGYTLATNLLLDHHLGRSTVRQEEPGRRRLRLTTFSRGGLAGRV